VALVNLQLVVEENEDYRVLTQVLFQLLPQEEVEELHVILMVKETVEVGALEEVHHNFLALEPQVLATLLPLVLLKVIPEELVLNLGVLVVEAEPLQQALMLNLIQVAGVVMEPIYPYPEVLQSQPVEAVVVEFLTEDSEVPVVEVVVEVILIPLLYLLQRAQQTLVEEAVVEDNLALTHKDPLVAQESSL
jgi:hypothetical protein